MPERKRALTIAGPIDALTKVLEILSSQPHSWQALPFKRDGQKASVRLRWAQQPNYRELGGIIYLAQLNGLRIADTDLIEWHD
jgi:hypothetical protein